MDFSRPKSLLEEFEAVIRLHNHHRWTQWSIARWLGHSSRSVVQHYLRIAECPLSLQQQWKRRADNEFKNRFTSAVVQRLLAAHKKDVARGQADCINGGPEFQKAMRDTSLFPQVKPDSGRRCERF